MLELTNPKVINQQLRFQGLRLNKRLGQHFILSQKVIGKIIKAANLSRPDVVLEIGPGLGSLTVELAQYVNKVIAVEKDQKLAELLQKNLKTEGLRNVEVINQDVLKFSITSFQFSNPKFKIQNLKFKLVANLPYQITSPVLWKFLYEEEKKPELMVMMVQKEVADRLLARPGQMSLLSVLAQRYAQPELVSLVKSGQFFPPPRVHSAVVKLKIKNEKRTIKENLFFKLVKMGFASKRKQLVNNLKPAYSQTEVVKALRQAKMPATARAQELSVADWLKVYEVLYNTSRDTGGLSSKH